LIRRLPNRWNSESGYRDLLRLSIPLTLSAGSWIIQQAVDRIFLTWFSSAAVAAALPAGLVNWTILSIPIGTASTVGTFVAQYTGARRGGEIGPMVWQGLYLSLATGLVVLSALPLAPWLFGLAGHAPDIRRFEITYFQILLAGAFPATASAAISGFFSGRGKPWTVVWVTAAATATNVAGDYALIFGRFGFPRLGVAGAALATVLSQVVSSCLYFFLFLRPAHRIHCRTLEGWRFERGRLFRLMRFGVPSGIHAFLETVAFTFFLLLVGRWGMTALAASNIAFNINNIIFLPMVGFGMAAGVHVGQRLGENRPDLAARGAWSVFHLTFLFMAVVAFLYVAVPDLFLFPYRYRADPSAFAPVADLAKRLLRFVAAYSIFDTMNIVFASAVKGAGDTRFVMAVSMGASVLLLAAPSYLVGEVLHLGIDALWITVTLYITCMGLVFLLRFLGGSWKSMRVIEAGAVPFGMTPVGR